MAAESESDDDGVTYDLVMPFVACVSKGGAYDDQAFVAGWECGALDARLQAMTGAACMVERWVPPNLIPQLDLIAMKHDLALQQVQTSDDGEYVRVMIGHPGLVDSDRDEG